MTIAGAREVEALAPLADDLEKAVGTFGEVAMYMGKTAMSAEVMKAFANAHPFMTVTGIFSTFVIKASTGTLSLSSNNS